MESRPFKDSGAMRYLMLVVVALLSFTLSSSGAQGKHAFIVATKATELVHAGEMDEAHLTLLGFTLGKHTVQNVEGLLGKPKEYVGVDQHGKDVCYVSESKGDNTRVIFGTGMMGDWEDLLNFQLIAGHVNFKESKKCKRSPLVSKNVATASGLKLGMSQELVKTILGSPTKENKERLLFEYDTHKQTTIGGQTTCLSVGSWIEATFSRSRLTALLAVRIEESDVPEACEPKEMLQKKEG